MLAEFFEKFSQRKVPSQAYNKFKTPKIKSLGILEKINSNAYRLQRLPHTNTFDVFNIKHLVQFEDEDFREIQDIMLHWLIH